MHFFEGDIKVVCLLENERFEFHVGKLFVEGAEELHYSLNDLIGEVDQVVAHVENLSARVHLIIHLLLQLVLVCLLRVSLLLLQVLLRNEESIRLNRLYSYLHLFEDKLALVNDFEERLGLFSEGFEGGDALKQVLECQYLEGLSREASRWLCADIRIISPHLVILYPPVVLG